MDMVLAQVKQISFNVFANRLQFNEQRLKTTFLRPGLLPESGTMVVGCLRCVAVD